MKKISNTDFQRLRGYASHLDDIREEIVAIVYEAQQKVEEAMTRLNDYIDEANGFASDLFTEAESYYDERSDNWRDGDTGQTYREWMDEIEDVVSGLESRSFELDASEITSDIEAMCEALNNVRQTYEE